MRIETDLSVYAFSGSGVKKVFKNEVGTHTWQRVSPTEKRGRTHTSSITVAVLDKQQFNEIEVRPDEVRIERTIGTGKGGQNKNRRSTCIVMTHYATGIKVVRDGRKQHKNLEDAYKEMTKRINDYYRSGHIENESSQRREQINLTDKRRTYRVKDGLVIDHITDKQTKLKNILRGKIELLQ